MTVSTEQIDSSESDLASLLRQDNNSDGSDDDCRCKADINRITPEDLGLRKAANSLRRRLPSSSDTKATHDPPPLRSPAKTYSEPSFHTVPGDLNPPCSSSPDGEADDTETTQQSTPAPAAPGDYDFENGPSSPRWEQPTSSASAVAAVASAAAAAAGAGRNGGGGSDGGGEAAGLEDLGFSFRSGSFAAR
jgi:hypothetical protein